MEFRDIDATSKVFPGEYLLYAPQQRIVMCGAFNRLENYIRAFGDGNAVQDTIEKFKKIHLEQEEVREYREKRRRCKGCGS